MKNVIVTGGQGFIGSNLVDELINEGYNVKVIDDQSSEANEQFYVNDKAQYYKISITDKDQLTSSKVFENVDLVFHLAAEARIQPTLEHPEEACYTNFYGTCVILQLCREFGVKRLIYSSTSSAYGLKNYIPLREDMPKDCLNPYSVSKSASEDLCKMYYTLWGVETVNFRYFNVYGERQPLKGQYAPVIGIFLRQRAAGQTMTIIGDGTQTRDFTHVSDVVKANILAATSPNKNILGELFNVGAGRNHSILDIAKMMGGEYEFLPPRLGESQDTLADISKISTMLDYKPSVRLEDWINANK